MSELLHVVCPNCDAVNRVPKAKLDAGTSCGGCHQALFQALPLTLSAANFAHHIDRSDLPILIDFWAPWCGPCRTMAPAFVEAARLLEPAVRLAKVNTEEAQSLATKFNIRSIPTLVLFCNGQERARISGAMGANDLVAWTRAQV